jgi:hypothetical protein
MQQEKKYCSTEEFSEKFTVKADTIRRGLCVRGHYLGVKPIKLPNGRLLWPNVSPEQLAKEA